jgi:hypothetical protein
MRLAKATLEKDERIGELNEKITKIRQETQ